MAEKSWDELVERTRGGDVRPGTMFGSAGLRTGTKFFAIWWHDQLVLKLPAGRREELVGSGRAAPFVPMESRPMNGWVVVGDQTPWQPLVEEARDFVAAQ